MKRRLFFAFFGIVFVFLFLRAYHLVESLNFGTDQGIHILEILTLVNGKKFTLIGPTASFSASGRYVFTSSLMYYITLPVLLLSNWNIIAVSYFMIFLQLVGLLVLLYVISSKVNTPTALFFGLLFSCLPLLVEYSRFLWNPNFLVSLSCLLLALLLSIRGKRNARIYFLLGSVGGVGVSMHYSFALAIVVSFLYLVVRKMVNSKSFLLLSGGFLLGFSPIILFDIRHQFYNLQTMLFIFTAQNTQHTSFSLLPHYFLSVIPFFIFGASYVLTLLWKKNTYTAQCAIVVFLFWSLWTLLPIPDHGFTMTTGWNYEGVHKVAEIIKSEHPDTYNVVDILTGDTRAMAVRSLLTLWGNPPLAVDRYPESETLYIFSRVPIEQILEGEMWETSFITPGTVLKRWNIQNDVQLYAVKKGEVQ